MILTIPAFWVVLLIVIIHTVLQHLLSWASRKSEPEARGIIAFGWLFEAFFLIAALASALF